VRVGGVGDGVGADADVEALGAAVFGVAAEGVAAGKLVAAEGADVVAGFQVDLRSALVGGCCREGRGGAYGVKMSVEVGLALKLLRARRVADHGGAWVRVLAVWVVRLHVRFPVVAAFEKLAASVALVGRFFWRGPLALLLDTGHRREH
jgi:hypothetical protein